MGLGLPCDPHATDVTLFSLYYYRKCDKAFFFFLPSYKTLLTIISHQREQPSLRGSVINRENEVTLKDNNIIKSSLAVIHIEKCIKNKEIKSEITTNINLNMFTV